MSSPTQFVSTLMSAMVLIASRAVGESRLTGNDLEDCIRELIWGIADEAAMPDRFLLDHFKDGVVDAIHNADFDALVRDTKFVARDVMAGTLSQSMYNKPYLDDLIAWGVESAAREAGAGLGNSVRDGYEYSDNDESECGCPSCSTSPRGWDRLEGGVEALDPGEADDEGCDDIPF